MSDTRSLLDRISAFRNRLGTKSGATVEVAETATAVAEPEAFRQTLRRITGAATLAESPMPPQLTARGRQLLQTARDLLARQRKFTADPVFNGFSGNDTDPIVTYNHETTSVMDSAVRMAQVFPDSPTVQLKLCDGLEGVLSIVKERL